MKNFVNNQCLLCLILCVLEQLVPVKLSHISDSKALISVSTNCSGTYDSIDMIVSYPGPSRIVSDCLWNFTISEDAIINLHFLKFSIEDSIDCNTSHLLIYEAIPTKIDTDATKLCGNVIPDNIQYSGSEMQLKFVSRRISDGVDNSFQIKVDVKEYEVFEGDILLEEEDAESIDEFSEAISKRDRLWTIQDGIVSIPYTMSTWLKNDEKIKIERAFEEYHSKTCIRFVPRQNQPDYINFFPAPACKSFLGRRKGKQPVKVGRCETPGNIIHELYHTVGFFHENTRPDRDLFLEVNFTAVYDFEKSYYHKITNRTARNYFKCNESKLGRRSGCQILSPYDLKSISHYPATIPDTEFLNRNFTVIKVRDGTCTSDDDCSFGQRNGLSKNDVLDIAMLYGCGSQWNNWEPYDECCKGKRTRKRTCSNNYSYDNNVIKCYGDTEETRTCPELISQSCGNVQQEVCGEFCTKENVCFCKDDVCIRGGSCSTGNVFFRGKPICDDGWDIEDADVICRQLGFQKAKLHTARSRFGEVSNKFSMSNVNCEGDEISIQDCLHRKFDFCSIGDAAGVECLVQ